MNDDLVAELTRADGIVAVTKETVVALIGEVGRLKAKSVQESARIEALEAENARLRSTFDDAADLIKRQQGWQEYGEQLERNASATMAAEIQEQRQKNAALRDESAMLKARADAAESALASTKVELGETKLVLEQTERNAARVIAEAGEALDSSMVAIDDWLHIHASDMCNETDVLESEKRVGEYGTIYYIATIQEKNRAARAFIQQFSEKGM